MYRWPNPASFLAPRESVLLPNGVFEAPPAMLRDISAWVASIYASHVLQHVDN